MEISNKFINWLCRRSYELLVFEIRFDGVPFLALNISGILKLKTLERIIIVDALGSLALSFWSSEVNWGTDIHRSWFFHAFVGSVLIKERASCLNCSWSLSSFNARVWSTTWSSMDRPGRTSPIDGPTCVGVPRSLMRELLLVIDLIGDAIVLSCVSCFLCWAITSLTPAISAPKNSGNQVCSFSVPLLMSRDDKLKRLMNSHSTGLLSCRNNSWRKIRNGYVTRLKKPGISNWLRSGSWCAISSTSSVVMSLSSEVNSRSSHDFTTSCIAVSGSFVFFKN